MSSGKDAQLAHYWHQVRALTAERDAAVAALAHREAECARLRMACLAMRAFFETDEASDEARDDGDIERADELAALAVVKWQCIPDLIDEAISPILADPKEGNGRDG